MRKPTDLLRALLVALTLLAAILGLVVGTSGPVSAAAGSATSRGAASAPMQADDTTSTLPPDYQTPGHSVTRPNTGAEPQDAGDPGGWLQSSLFFIICGAVFVMCGIVWYQSRRARERRRAAGLDPVSLARSAGAGVRAPSPLDPKPEPEDAV